MVAELVYGGKTLAEIAGYDDAQTHFVLFRKRDKDGVIVRKGGKNDYPDHVKFDSNGMRVITNPCGYREMYLGVHRKRGVKDLDKTWDGFLTKREEEFNRFKAWIREQKNK
jgi:hypothetical protein